jgi:hypothetical protein
MIRLKAQVRGGRLVVDEPTDLPEGAEVELIAADSWDDLDDDERERLHAALASSEDDVHAGGGSGQPPTCWPISGAVVRDTLPGRRHRYGRAAPRNNPGMVDDQSPRCASPLH